MVLVFKNMGCTVCTINSVSFQTPVAMDPVTILLGGALLIAPFLFLLASDKKKAEIARLVNKLHGPTSYPIFGTSLPFIFIKRKGKKCCRIKSEPLQNPRGFHKDLYNVTIILGVRDGAVVEALRYKPESRGIDSRWCH
jgi:hypothetical protein